MDQTRYRQNLLNQIFSELQGQAVVKNKKDFAEKVHYDYCCMSSAFNGNHRYLTDKLFYKVFSAFPALNKANYPLSVDDSPIQINKIPASLDNPSAGQHSSISQINKILMLLEQQQQLTANSQTQIDKMIKSIDKLVEQVCKLSANTDLHVSDITIDNGITK